MAVVAVDELRLLKTMRWWDGFVIGLACPGFILAGLAGSTGALGPELAAAIWFASAVVGALQAYIYSEPAAMFPDKGGGLSMYAMEGWRKYFSLAGPIATFGYWFAWSSVLAIYGVIIGTLICAKYFPEQVYNILFTIPGLGFDVTWPRLIGTVCVLACFIFNIRGMRPAVWFSYATGLMMVIPVLALCILPFLTGDFDSSRLSDTTSPADLDSAASQLGVSVSDLYADKTAYLTDFYGTVPSMLVLGLVWFWVIGWSTYGPEAPATFAPEYVDTARDTRLAIVSTGIMNTFCALLLPIAIIGMLGYAAVANDFTYIAFLTTAMDNVVGDTVGGIFILFICGGLLLSMNTATMDGSRALYGMAREGLTIKWLGVLNHHHVPSRAMTLDVVMNLFLIYAFPNVFFVLAAGNIGYVFAHVLALSGVLLLRRDRPDWPRPIRLGAFWMVLAGALAVFNLILTIVGTINIKYTGYLYSVGENASPTGYQGRAIFVGLAAVALGVIGYVIGQRQHGRPFRFTDPSNEEPTDEAYLSAGLKVPARQ